MKMNIWYFTGTGQSEQMAKQIQLFFKTDEVKLFNMTGAKEREKLVGKSICDQLMIVFPVYGSEMPLALKEAIRQLDGEGVPVILIALWGKAHKENAIYHAAKLLEERGFVVNGGIEVPTKHSYLEEKYPIPLEVDNIAACFRYINEKRGKVKAISICKESVMLGMKVICAFPEGTMPKIATKINFAPALCKECNLCIHKCPKLAIKEDYSIDEKRCIRCLSCVTNCPYEARTVKVKKVAKVLLNKHVKQQEIHFY